MAATSVTASQPKSHYSHRFVVRLPALLLVLYVAACAFFYFSQDRMTFPAPTTYPRATPLDAGVPFEDLHIPVNGSEQIHGWWVPAASSSSKILLVFHGNGYVLEQTVAEEMIPLHSKTALPIDTYWGRPSLAMNWAQRASEWRESKAGKRMQAMISESCSA